MLSPLVLLCKIVPYISIQRLHFVVTSNSENMFQQPIITTSETSSKNVSQQSSVETIIHEGIKSSVSTYEQSNKESLIPPTSVKSEFVLKKESKYDVVNTSIKTVLSNLKLFKQH